MKPPNWPTILLAMLLLIALSAFFDASEASKNLEMPFEVIDWGNMNGYCEETYIVVRNEAEWEGVWEKHTLLESPPRSLPEINFSRNIIVCVFMGKCPTAGYKISIDRIWTDGEFVHVEIVKSRSSNDLAVAQIITRPFIIASLNSTNLHFVFHVAEEYGVTTDYILPEFPEARYLLVLFVALSAAIIASKSLKKANP
ncbi:MAG: protease complex subunit PrcB family protein [Candidatus Bathyarchaeia archaeon]